jgi:hypothetical protein
MLFFKILTIFSISYFELRISLFSAECSLSTFGFNFNLLNFILICLLILTSIFLDRSFLYFPPNSKLINNFNLFFNLLILFLILLSRNNSRLLSILGWEMLNISSSYLFNPLTSYLIGKSYLESYLEYNRVSHLSTKDNNSRRLPSAIRAPTPILLLASGLPSNSTKLLNSTLLLTADSNAPYYSSIRSYRSLNSNPPVSGVLILNKIKKRYDLTLIIYDNNSHNSLAYTFSCPISYHLRWIITFHRLRFYRQLDQQSAGEFYLKDIAIAELFHYQRGYPYLECYVISQINLLELREDFLLIAIVDFIKEFSMSDRKSRMQFKLSRVVAVDRNFVQVKYFSTTPLNEEGVLVWNSSERNYEVTLLLFKTSSSKTKLDSFTCTLQLQWRRVIPLYALGQKPGQIRIGLVGSFYLHNVAITKVAFNSNRPFLETYLSPQESFESLFWNFYLTSITDFKLKYPEFYENSDHKFKEARVIWIPICFFSLKYPSF